MTRRAGFPRNADEATARARSLYPRSRGFQGAYLRGWRAGRAGRPIDACPYERTEGWAAWRVAWGRGWLAGRRSIQSRESR